MDYEALYLHIQHDLNQVMLNYLLHGSRVWIFFCLCIIDCCFMWMHVIFALRLFFSFKKLVLIWSHLLWIQTWLWRTECGTFNPAFQRNWIRNALLSSMTLSRAIKFFFCLVVSPWNKVMKILRFYVLFNFYILNFFNV